MLPQKRIEPDQAEGRREGFEVRVIGEGSLRPAFTDEEIEIGVHIGAGKPRHVVPDDSSDPVHRLEVEVLPDRLGLKTTGDVGPAAPYSPRSKKKKRYNLKHWTVWMGVVSCSVVIVAVVGKLAARKPPQEEAAKEVPIPASPSSPAAQERDYLIENLGRLRPGAEALLTGYATAKTAGEALPAIRNAATLGPLFTSHWQPWGEGATFARDETLEPMVDLASPRPALILRGRKGNLQPFEFYLVRESTDLRIDWEASEGRGDFTIADLESGAKAKDSIVRAVVSPSTFFTPMYAESSFRSYQLKDLSGKHAVWAFVPLASEAAGILKQTLSEDSLILSTGSEAKATLRVSRDQSEVANLFLITEILHNGWVSP